MADPIACRYCGTPLTRHGDVWVHIQPGQNLHCPGWMRPEPAEAPEPEPADDRLPDWRHHAACLGEDPELFFPIADNRDRMPPGQLEAARAVCHRCPVRAECEQWAIETGQAWGIWGGLTPAERRPRMPDRAGVPVSCDRCGNSFVPYSSRQRLCGPACRRAHAHDQRNWRRQRS